MRLKAFVKIFQKLTNSITRSFIPFYLPQKLKCERVESDEIDGESRRPDRVERESVDGCV